MRPASAILLLGFLAAAGTGPLVPTAAPVRAQASAPSCAPAVDGQLRAWDATGPPRDEPASTVRHWPTRTLGTWVTEHRPPAAPVLLRVTPSQLTRVEWTAECVARSTILPRPQAETPRFTDADVASLVSTGQSGVIYTWSPHMPLSVDGYRAVVAAAVARDLTVHPVLAPGADRAFARAALDRGGLPPTALRLADSVELEFRGLHVHAPAILVFTRGRLVGSVWPGYHDATEYGVFLDRVLAER